MQPAGAVVVTWNAEEQIGVCLDALLAQGVTDVVVVDNASEDGTVAQVRRRPAVRLIANPWNRGFAAAANQGIEALDAPCVLLINPDAELLTPLDAMRQACCLPGVAAVGGKLLDRQGRPQAGFMLRRFPTPAALISELFGLNRLWPANPINRRFRCLDLDPEAPGEVEQPAGAFLMLRREVWRELGGFEESFYPLWFEDVDWLRRAQMAGYRILYEPRVVARHLGAGCVRKMSWEQRQYAWYDNLFRYVARHFSSAGCRTVLAAGILATAVRGAGGIVRAGLPAARVCARIIQTAARRLLGGDRQGLNYGGHGRAEQFAGGSS